MLKTVGHVQTLRLQHQSADTCRKTRGSMCHGYKRLGKTMTKKGSAGKALSPHKGKPARKCHKQLGEKCHNDGFTGNS